MARKKAKRPVKKTTAKKPHSRTKKKTKKKAKKKTAKKVAAKKSATRTRPRGRPRKRPAGPPASARPRCQGTRVDGQPCTALAVVEGYCGRHKNQIDKPATWAETSVEEIERRKQFALMRRRELEVGEQEGRLVDTSLATMEALRLANLIQDTWGSFPARRSHEIAAKLGVKVGDVSAILEAMVREELRQIAESL